MYLNNINTEGLCTGCLSTGRKLFFIGETGFYHLYSQILNEIPVYDLSQVCVRICWECRARLRTMELFKQQVQRNYKDLMQRIPLRVTSKLSSYLQYNLSYPETLDVKAEFVGVVKSEPEEHCERQFASALDVGLYGTTDTPKDQKKSKSKVKPPSKILVKRKRKKRESNYIIPEIKENTDYFDDLNEEYNEVGHNEKGYNEEKYNEEGLDEEKYNEESQKQVKKQKSKLKSSSKLKVESKRKKREQNNIIADIEESADHFDDIKEEHNEVGHNEKGYNEVGHHEKEYNEVGHHEKEYNEESQKQEKKPKNKLKSSSKLIVKKTRKKRETNNIIPDSKESADHLDDTNEEHNDVGYNDGGYNEEGTNEGGHNEEGHIEDTKNDNFDNEKTETIPKVPIEKAVEVLPKVLKRKKNTEVLPDRPQCQECGKVFSSKKTYKYHLNVLHRGQNKYPCPRCGKVYQWKSNLGRHMRTHRAVDDGELYCVQCDKSYASVATYRQHLRLSRRHVAQADFSFECGECGARFVNKTRLRDHVDWEHLNRIKFRCALCEKPFKCQTSLYIHTQNVHIARERRENLCHVCGKSYQNAAKLKYHITAMHSGETPYRCALCAAAFGWYSSLYRHMREVHYKMKGVTKKAKNLKQSILRGALTDTSYTPH